VVNRANAVVNVTIDAPNWKRFAPQLNGFLAQLPREERSGESWPSPIGPTNEGLTIPAKVNYVAKGANIYHAGYALHGSAAVITNYLRAGYLWDRVRVQGGAYGAFCSLDARSGVFTFGSYRDPNIEQTVSVYDAAAAFLRDQTVGEEELTKSIIGAIGTIDAYRLPDARGYASMVRYLTGETDEWRQQFREELLGTTPQHIRDFADAMDAVREHGSVVVVGSQEAMEKAGNAFGGRPTMTRVM
jgi:Zn-dependent M16 (insulinase) family peptidase